MKPLSAAFLLLTFAAAAGVSPRPALCDALPAAPPPAADAVSTAPAPAWGKAFPLTVPALGDDFARPALPSDDGFSMSSPGVDGGLGAGVPSFITGLGAGARGFWTYPAGPVPPARYKNIPPCCMVFGLKTMGGTTYVTDKNGALMHLPRQPQEVMCRVSHESQGATRRVFRQP